MFLPRGLAAQVSFREAVELAAKRSVAVPDDFARQDTYDDSCDDTVSNFAERADNLAWVDSLGSTTKQYPPPVTKSPTVLLPKSREAKSQAPVLPPDVLRRHAVLCTALAYAKLAAINSQMAILRGQEVTAERLLKVEIQRVVKRMDDPVVLSRAKLLLARTRMLAAKLECSALRSRKQLAELTGLPQGKIELVADSVPPLLEVSSADIEMRACMRQVSAARDVAQLEHVLVRTQRMSTRGKVVTGKANLGDLLAAYIAEDEKFVALLETNFAFDSAKLQMLDVNGRLENWAMDTAPRPEEGMIAQTITASSVPETATTSPAVRSIMITPGVSKLSVGQSQQFSAIAIYSKASARNVTSEAVWQCSSNSDVIVSSSGLVTALATGQVRVTANFGGVSQPRQIKITADDSMP
jgi:hypothetical protein